MVFEGLGLDLYADDTTLSASTDMEDLPRLRDLLTLAVNNVEDWTRSNKLPLNETKSKTLLVTGKRFKVPANSLSVTTSSGSTLEQSDSVRLLGLNLDCNLF